MSDEKTDWTYVIFWLKHKKTDINTWAVNEIADVIKVFKTFPGKLIRHKCIYTNYIAPARWTTGDPIYGSFTSISEAKLKMNIAGYNCIEATEDFKDFKFGPSFKMVQCLKLQKF